MEKSKRLIFFFLQHDVVLKLYLVFFFFTFAYLFFIFVLRLYPCYNLITIDLCIDSIPI
jgi:hypothetical protein